MRWRCAVESTSLRWIGSAVGLVRTFVPTVEVSLYDMNFTDIFIQKGVVGLASVSGTKTKNRSWV